MAVINPYNYSRPNVGGNFKMNIVTSEKSDALQSLNPMNKKISHQQQDKYLEQKVLTAKPEELVSMLYEGLVKFIKFSLMYLEQSNIEKVNEYALKSQAIVSELQSTLDMNYAISNQLEGLYVFIHTKLSDGNVKKDAKSFEEALEISELMLEMWKEMLGSLRNETLRESR